MTGIVAEDLNQSHGSGDGVGYMSSLIFDCDSRESARIGQTFVYSAIPLPYILPGVLLQAEVFDGLFQSLSYSVVLSSSHEARLSAQLLDCCPLDLWGSQTACAIFRRRVC